MEDEKRRTEDIIADMTRQFKATNEQLLKQDADLSSKINLNTDELENLNGTFSRLTQDKDDKIAALNEQISELDKHIHSLSTTFHNML